MKTWKIRGLALAACLAFVTTACESKNAAADAGGRDAGNGGGPYASGDAASASGNYYFDDDDDEIVAPDGTLIGEDDPVAVVKARNGVARISSSGGTVRVEGDVKEIDVNGSDVDVVADSAAKVRVSGSDVDVFVRRVSSVHFDGSDNDVRWTDGAMPSVTDNGAENEIRRARPAPAR